MEAGEKKAAKAEKKDATEDEDATKTKTTTTTTSRSSTTTTTPLTTTTPTPASYPPGQFSCTSPYTVRFSNDMAGKGLCVDDTTFKDCPEKIPGVWPNTAQRVMSLRLFKPWHPDWGREFMRMRAWRLLAAWVRSNGARVLVGTEVTCDAQRDDDMWLWALELMRLLGRRHVMGVAVGNEMDLFRERGAEAAGCSAAVRQSSTVWPPVWVTTCSAGSI